MTKKTQRGRSRLVKVASGAASLLLSMTAYSQSMNFNIPAGELSTAIDNYLKITGQQIIYKGEDIQGQKTSGAQGSLTPEQALARLLDGTSLSSRTDGSGAVVIFPAGAMAGRAERKENANTEIAPVEVVMVYGNPMSHLGDVSRTGTRTDADPMTVPMSITTVDKALLAQQQAKSLADAIANVAGVSEVAGDNVFTMRGFNAGVMRNGNLVPSGDGFDSPLIAVSRIEVVKGPEAIIAGLAAGYGGVINVITKTPQRAPVTEVSAVYGSRGYHEVAVDFGRPLNDSKSLLARFVASKQESGQTISGYDGSDRLYVSPSISWKDTRLGTEVVAQYEYQSGHEAPASIVYTDQPSLTSDLKTRRFGEASDGKNLQSKIMSLSLSQRISDEWDIGIKLNHERRLSDLNSALGGTGDFLGYPYPNIISYSTRSLDVSTNRTAKLEIKGHINTGPLEHKLLLAYDYRQTHDDRVYRLNGLFMNNIDTGAFTDLVPMFGEAFGIPSSSTPSKSAAKETGLLLMDQITWDNWSALAGVREIHYSNDEFDGVGVKKFAKALPSLGILYRLSADVSLYGSASKGFVPNSGNYGVDGKLLPPENARQMELGVKSLLMNKKIAASAAIYNIKQTNYAVGLPTQIGLVCQGVSTVCYESVPGVRSKGVEFELSGEITPHLDIRASYSVNDKKASSPDMIGIYFAKQQASIWTTYRFTPSGQGGFWLGGGVQSRSARNEILAANARNPGNARIDLSMGYDAKSWSLIAGVKNVADRRLYVLGSGVSGAGIVQQPREFNVTARYNFN